jgi:hypothetical protein
MVVRRSLRRLAPATRIALAAPLALALPAAARAQVEAYPSQERYHLRFEYRDYHPKLDATLQHGTSEKDGTPIDLLKDLEVADKRTFELRGAIQIKRGHKLRGSYTPLDYRGDTAEARRNFTYGATDFQRFDHVLSTFKGGYYGASYEYDFVRGPKGYFGAVLGGRLLDLDAVIASPENGKREIDTVRTPVPVLGATTRVYTGRMSVETELVGFSLGSKGSLWEFETSARIHLSDRLAAEGGYRRLSIKGEDGHDNGDVKLKGWHFGLELSL